MISTTLIYPDDVVVDTYYKDGQGINQLRALDEMAAALGIQAQLEVAPDNAQNAIHISGTQEPYLSLSLFHVTDSKHDKTLRFEALGNESFVNDDPALTALLSQRGIWYLELRGADNDWRLRQRIVTPIRRLEF